MEHVHVSETSNATVSSSSSGEQSALFFFLGLVTIWTAIILLSLLVARCTNLPSRVDEEKQKSCEEINTNIITKRAISLPKKMETDDVETGCDTSNDDTQECPICMSSFQEDDTVSWSQNRNCRHAFHHSCIMPWLLKDCQCPICRQPFCGIASHRTETSFFSVQLGVIDVDSSAPEQANLLQYCLISQEHTAPTEVMCDQIQCITCIK